MEPPPGSVPHPIGQGVAVGFRVSAARAKLMLVMGTFLGLVYGTAVVLLTWGAQTVPALAFFVLLMLPLGMLTVMMALGQAAVMRGPLLVVDDAGIRTRDLVGWIQVPWATLQQMSTSRGGSLLELEAPGGVYLNERLMARRSRHRAKIGPLQVDPQHLMTYLEHRRVLAWQAVPR